MGTQSVQRAQWEAVLLAGMNGSNDAVDMSRLYSFNPASQGPGQWAARQDGDCQLLMELPTPTQNGQIGGALAFPVRILGAEGLLESWGCDSRCHLPLLPPVKMAHQSQALPTTPHSQLNSSSVLVPLLWGAVPKRAQDLAWSTDW